MSLFDRLFRRGRGGADSRRAATDTATPYPTDHPSERGEGGEREGQIDPSVQQIQVGEEGSSQQIDVGGSSDSGGGGSDSGGGGDGGGGGGGE